MAGSETTTYDAAAGAVLLTGATGYIGGKLLDQLLDDRVVLRALVRDPARLPEAVNGRGFDVVTADLADEETLREALADVDEAFYLVHSMEPGVAGGFAARDRSAAQNYAKCAAAAGVRRTIYLGAVSPEGAVSEHPASRREVEDILAAATPEFVGLRASMIVGVAAARFARSCRSWTGCPCCRCWLAQAAHSADRRRRRRALSGARSYRCAGGLRDRGRRGSEL